MTRPDDQSIVSPEQVGVLIVQPLADTAIATQCSTTVHTDSSVYRLPQVVEDPSAGWVPEAGEIPVTDAQVAELSVTPAKLAGLTAISAELAEDSDPSATQIVQDGLVRDLGKKLDAAYFGNLGAPAPAGLESLTAVTEVDAGAAWADLDAFSQAQSEAEQLGVTLDSFAAHPIDARTLAQLTDEDGSRRPLLGTDPTVPSRRQVFGTPLRVSPYVTPGTVWGIPRSRSYVVMRKSAEISISPHPYFTSDKIAIRVIVRVGLGFPQPAALVKVTLGSG